MNSMIKFLLTILTAIVFYGTATAGIVEEHKLVIQVNTEEAKNQEIALNYAVNVLNHYEPGEVKVEIVAHGAGISLLSKSRKNKFTSRIESLVKSGIVFSVCNNSINDIEKKYRKKPEIIEGVKIIPDGTVRIMRLQEKGYSYIRP
ncbi:MAG: DsrE family protein [Gammaproteobacteria bacterium]|nr:DsrE family protein [Gammaproteobacteria bacterium]MDH5659713.1 DsrE family protein [Gammaproteobacteria bacterium]